MRYLVLSDMHANWPAFSLVLESFGTETFDRVLVLGDLVGYGARPNEVVEAVQSGKPSPFALEEIVNVSRVTFAMLESAATGAPVKIEP